MTLFQHSRSLFLVPNLHFSPGEFLSTLPPQEAQTLFLTGAPTNPSLSSPLPATQTFSSLITWLCSFSQYTYTSLTVAGISCLPEDWDSQDPNLPCSRLLKALREALEKHKRPLLSRFLCTFLGGVWCRRTFFSSLVFAKCLHVSLSPSFFFLTVLSYALNIAQAPAIWTEMNWMYFHGRLLFWTQQTVYYKALIDQIFCFYKKIIWFQIS